MERSFEREIIPMARSEGNYLTSFKADECRKLKKKNLGMALVPWNVLAGGKIRTDEEEERRRKTGENGRTISLGASGWERNEREKKVCKALEKVAAEIGAKHITSGNLSTPKFFFNLADFFFTKKSLLHISCRRHHTFSRLLEVERSNI